MLRLRLNPQVRQDIREILAWSARRFGPMAASRYSQLILQSFLDLQLDPVRIGSKTYPDLLIDSARIYPLSFSRTHVLGKPVGDPRHVLLYRVHRNTLFVARILHDSNDLPRHIPKNLQR